RAFPPNGKFVGRNGAPSPALQMQRQQSAQFIQRQQMQNRPSPAVQMQNQNRMPGNSFHPTFQGPQHFQPGHVPQSHMQPGHVQPFVQSHGGPFVQSHGGPFVQSHAGAPAHFSHPSSGGGHMSGGSSRGSGGHGGGRGRG